MCAVKKYLEKNGSLHEQSKTFLEKNGLRLEDARLAEWFKKRGFEIEDGYIKFKDHEIEHALKLCPPVIHLKAGKSDLEIGGSEKFYGFTGAPEFLLKSSSAHIFQKKDGINLFKLVDTSRIINFSERYPWFYENRRATEQMAFFLKYSNKPPVLLPGKWKDKADLCGTLQSLNDYFEQKKACQLAVPLEVYDDRAVTWSQIECLECTTGFHQAILLKIHSAVKENELITEEALCVRINAVALGYCCILQTLWPGYPVIFGLSNRIVCGQKNKFAVGIINRSILAVTAQVWRYYQIPFMLENITFEAQSPDVFAGIEATSRYREMFDHFQSDLMNFSLGALDCERAFCIEKYLTDEEIIEMLVRLYQGIDCSEKMNGYSAVKNAGPRGSYFNTRMLKLIKKEFYDSRYLNKESLGNWRSENENDLIDYVGRALQKRLKFYVPPEITKEKKMLLDKYLRAEDDGITQFRDIKF
ncbi:trimethylamine methyltransferase family protein [Eubacterium sp. 1001713B170207_170306_E7]|uniref:trimethylamine methyltransferase family protein n=1 Tax=Eubacterium sp. 1001713B170207_170306_E7 TaxID=2787097 RepID=UPI00189BD1A5|nr:trimethylamine methyltransferase family protein [Eubacterium sp. 1001713B170207_170306_E7]